MPTPTPQWRASSKKRTPPSVGNDLELILTMLGEASTTEIAKDAQGFPANKRAANAGGNHRVWRSLS